MLNLFIPNLNASMDNNNLFIISFFLACAVFMTRSDNRIKYFWGIAFLLLIGKIYGLPLISLIGYLPVINMFGFTYNSGQCLSFMIAVLAGIGADKISEINNRNKILIIIILLIILTGAFYFNASLINNVQFWIKISLLSAMIPIIFLSRKFNMNYIILSLIFLEIFTFIPPDRIKKLDSFPEVPYINFLRSEQAGCRERVFGIKGSLYPNTAMAYQIDDLGIYNPVLNKYIVMFFRGVIHQDYFSKSYFPAIRNNIDIYNRNLEIFNLRYLILPAKLYLPENKIWKLVYSDEVMIYKNIKALPRICFFTNYLYFEDDNMILDRMRNKKDDLHKICYISGSSPSVENIEISLHKSDLLLYLPDKVIIRIINESEGILLLNDAFYPGWIAFVNGKAEKIERANLMFRGVKIPKGENIVKFIFFPLSFYIPKIIFLAVMCILLISSQRSR